MEIQNGIAHVLSGNARWCFMIWSIPASNNKESIRRALEKTTSVRLHRILPIIVYLAVCITFCNSTTVPSCAPTAMPSTSPVMSPMSFNIAPFLGTGIGSSTGNLGQATSATVYYPYGVFQSSTGATYVAEYYGNAVRGVDKAGLVFQYIAGGGSSTGDGGPSTSATVFGPTDVWGTSNGVMYVVEYDANRVRVISGGIINTFAGTGETVGSEGCGDGGPATSALFSRAGSLSGDTVGNVYITDVSGCRIRRVNGGVITTYVGDGTCSYSGDGGNLGSGATAAQINTPLAVFADSVSNLYFSDNGNHRIRIVLYTSNNIATKVGIGLPAFNGDGLARTATAVNSPKGIWCDTSGVLRFSDKDNQRIRLIVNSIVYTIAGSGSSGPSSTSGAATASSFVSPNYLTGNTIGDMFVTDREGNVVRQLANLNPTMSPTLTPSMSPSAPPSLAPTYSMYPTQPPTSSFPTLPPVASPVNYVVSAVAGVADNRAVFAGSGSSYTTGLNYPMGICQDTLGAIYFAEYVWSIVSKVDSSSILSTFAGSVSGAISGDGGAATNAGFVSVRDVFCDTIGQVFVLDLGGCQVRLISSSGILSTFAGTGQCSADGTNSNGDGGRATAATLNNPSGVFGDSLGAIYISDTKNYKIRKVASGGLSTGFISTVMGTGVSGFTGDFWAPTSSMLGLPVGLCVDTVGGIYMADYGNNLVMWISSSTSNLAAVKMGNRIASYQGDGVSSSSLNGPLDVYADASKNVYIVDSRNQRIRFVKSNNNNIYTLVGTGAAGSSGNEGPGTSAAINKVDSIVGNTDGEFYFTDYASYTVRRLSIYAPSVKPSIVPTVKPSVNPTVLPSVAPSYAPVAAPFVFKISAQAGSTNGYSGDNGPSTAAQMDTPAGLWYSASTLYITDTTANVVRKTTAGSIYAVAGTYASYSNNGNGGPATSSALKGPQSVWVSNEGTIFVVESSRHVVRTIDSDGIISAFAGVNDVYSTDSNNANGDLGAATSATMYVPFGIAGDTNGNVYISDMLNYKVRAVSGGMIYTLIGTGGSNDQVGSCSGTLCTLTSPTGLFLDSAGYLFIAEHDKHKVYRYSVSANIMNVYAGSGYSSFNGDGIPATSCNIAGAYGVWASTLGVVYFADHEGSRIRMITASTNIVYTIAGTGTSSISGNDGYATAATVMGPVSVVGNAASTLYYSDDYGSVVRKLSDVSPTMLPTVKPTVRPTLVPTRTPSMNPSEPPTIAPSGAPSYAPVAPPVMYLIDRYAGNNFAVPTGTDQDLGPRLDSVFNSPYRMWLNTLSVLYLTDLGSCVVRTINTAGIVGPFAGVYGDGTSTGVSSVKATSSNLNTPYGVGGDTLGKVYITELDSAKVRVVDTDGIIFNFAGSGTETQINGVNGDGGAATAATFKEPFAVALDTVGNVYVAEHGDLRIRKITAVGGIISSPVGGLGDYVDGTPATSYKLYSPVGVFVDSVSTLYFCESAWSKVFRVDTATQRVYTLLGNMVQSFNGDGLPATSTAINQPRGFWQDSSGVSYFADLWNHRIRMISLSGIVYTIAGTGGSGVLGDDGYATAANIGEVYSGYIDTTGTIFFAENSAGTIRKLVNVNPTAKPSARPTQVPSASPSSAPSFTYYAAPLSFTISTLAGQAGVRDTYGDDGPATAAALYYPTGVWVDSTGRAYFADVSIRKVRRVSQDGILKVFAGSGASGNSGDGGQATSAAFNGPMKVWGDSVSSVYIVDMNYHSVRVINGVNSIISLYAGSYISSGDPTNLNGDGGQATSATLAGPSDICGDSIGNLYIADTGNFKIRKVDTSGIIMKVLGTGFEQTDGNDGKATSASISAVYGVYADSVGSLYLSCSDEAIIRRVDGTSQIITTFAGNGGSAFNGDGKAATATGFNYLYGVSGDSSGNLFVADNVHFRLRMISTAGSIVYTIAGNGIEASTGDGGAATSASLRPYYTWSFNDNLVCSDVAGFTIRKLFNLNPTTAPTAAPTSNFPSVAPTYLSMAAPSTYLIDAHAGNSLYSVESGDNGKATAAGFFSVTGVWASSTRTLIVDRTACKVRKVTDGIITTYAGSSLGSPTSDGTPATSAVLNGPIKAWQSNGGDLCIVLYDNNGVTCFSAGLMTQIRYAGTGAASVLPTDPNGDGGQSTSATFKHPFDFCGDQYFNLYIADYGNHKIRVVDSSNIVATIAGTGDSSPDDSDGPASSVAVGYPISICVDTVGVLYIIGNSDFNRIRRIDIYQFITTIAGSGSFIFNGDGLAATSANLNAPRALAADQVGNVYVGDYNNRRYRMVGTDSKVYTIAGSGSTGSSGDGGKATAATLQPFYSWVDETGNIVLSDIQGNVVRKLTSINPTMAPTLSVAPSVKPSLKPSASPSHYPTSRPTGQPTAKSTSYPTSQPSGLPSRQPSGQPTKQPASRPSSRPTGQPSRQPSSPPSRQPSSYPSGQPTAQPSRQPSVQPIADPTVQPSRQPSAWPSSHPSGVPSDRPSSQPSRQPTTQPSRQPTCQPSSRPSTHPSGRPSLQPTSQPSRQPSSQPTTQPVNRPSAVPSSRPSCQPMSQPSNQPSGRPSAAPTLVPSTYPSSRPSVQPTVYPSSSPSTCPSSRPSAAPSTLPTMQPSRQPTSQPSGQPAGRPSGQPSAQPLSYPSRQPSTQPLGRPTSQPSRQPSSQPTSQPFTKPSSRPSLQPSSEPSSAPTSAAFHAIQPKSTLPTGTKFSVTGPGNSSVRIVLPFLQVVPVIGAALTSIKLTNTGSYGTNYVVFGSQSTPASLSVTDPGVYAMTNAVSSDFGGRSVSVLVDFNGDGFRDLIIGDPFSARCYVLFGNSRGFVNMTDGFTIFGEQDSDLTGWSVSDAGDVNNDTLHDLIIGAPNSNSVGAVYVVYGRRRGLFDVYLTNLTSSHGFALYGSSRSDNLGISVAGAGDVNKDGCDDIVAGAALTSGYYFGAVYVVFGGMSLVASTSTATLSASQGFKITGVGFSVLGYSIAGVGDVNKDGIDDLLLGTSPQKSNVAASAYVVYGSRTPTSLVASALTTSQGFRINGGGVQVSYVGDVNRDGIKDLLIGGNYGLTDHAGFVLSTRVGYVVSPTISPTVAPSTTRVPTVTRTMTPTLSPTVKPSLRPSQSPSALPTAPTFQPTVGASAPSSRPSAAPSRPTLLPTDAPVLPSVAPTCEPSDAPSLPPTHEPSESPSVLPTVFTTQAPSILPSAVPSVMPSASPSVNQITRRPFQMPTVAPTVYVTPPLYRDVIIVTPPASMNSSGIATPLLVFNRTDQNFNFIVNASANVYIAEEGGQDRFSVYPQPNVTLTIAFFNVSCDVLDLTAFAPTIATLDDLSITAGSAIVALPDMQRIRIVNLQPTDLTVTNFEFGASYADDDGSRDGTGVTAQIITIATLSVGLAFLVLCGASYLWNRHNQMKSKQECELLVQEIIRRREGLIALNKNSTNRNSVCILQYTSAAGRNGQPRRRLVSWEDQENVDDSEEELDSLPSSYVASPKNANETDVSSQYHRKWNESFDSVYDDISYDSDLSYEFRRELLAEVFGSKDEGVEGTGSPMMSNDRKRARTISNSIWSVADLYDDFMPGHHQQQQLSAQYDVEQNHHSDNHEEMQSQHLDYIDTDSDLRQRYQFSVSGSVDEEHGITDDTVWNHDHFADYRAYQQPPGGLDDSAETDNHQYYHRRDVDTEYQTGGVPGSPNYYQNLL